jgi:hypothetical protein
MVGIMDDKPYEVMGGLSNLIEIPRDKAKGILVKNPRKTMNSIYDLRWEQMGIQSLLRIWSRYLITLTTVRSRE